MKNIYKLISMLVLCMILSVSITASNGSSTMDIYYGIQIAVDGQTATLTDANGNTVYPFTNNGTTYVPIRAVSELLGAGVYYEAETKTAHIFSKEVMDNYNQYGTVTAPETQSFMTQDAFDIFKLAMDVERCIDEYNYIDQNINGVLYKYILDEDEALDFISELHNTIFQLQINELKDISSWLTLNQYSYDYETRKVFVDMCDNLETAFSKMDKALEELENYIDPLPSLHEILVEAHYDNFEKNLEDARSAIILCSTACDMYIETYMNYFDDNIN